MKTAVKLDRQTKYLDFSTWKGVAVYRSVVKTERAYRAMTLQDVADKAGIHHLTVWHHENDVRFPRAETVGRILKALGLEGRWTIEL